jgi:signal transduction histidine kinase
MKGLPRSLFSRLYVRIWLAVVAAVLLAVALVMVAWHLSLERQQSNFPAQPRELVVRNAAGDAVGLAVSRPPRLPGEGVSFTLTLDQALAAGEPLSLQLPPRRWRPPMAMGSAPLVDGGPMGHRDPDRARARAQSRANGGLPDWMTPPFGFVWWMVLAGLAVALSAYPIIRRLTSRLEDLERGVQRWGSGELSLRLPVRGHDEVAELTKRFNSAAAQIEQLLLSHKALLANASHELRSPLARIRMGLELLPGPAGNAANDKLRTELNRNISELDQLVDEILLASRLDAVNADIGVVESVDLTGLAAEETARVNVGLEAQAVSVQGSAKLLRRLLRNLLENALKYAHSPDDQDAVVLTLGQQLSAKGQTMAVIWVEDRGPGVPAAERERIFEPFYRMRGASEKDGGVGLGLALVKSIALRHGGNVRCEERPGGGARFVVEMPVIGT